MNKFFPLSTILNIALLPAQAADNADDIKTLQPSLSVQTAAEPTAPLFITVAEPPDPAVKLAQSVQTIMSEQSAQAAIEPVQTITAKQPVAAALPTATDSTGDDSIAARIVAGKKRGTQEETNFLADSDMVSQLNQAGDKLLRQMDEAQQTNPIVSGIGAALLLEAVADGAVGKSKNEITAWLNVTGQTLVRMNSVLQLRDATLQQIAAMLIPVADDILPTYREYLQTAGFITAPDLVTLNALTAQATQQKIPAVLNHFDPNARLVLVHALHFTTPWQHPFNADNTAQQAFHLISSGKKGKKSVISVPTMQGNPQAALLQDDEAHITAIALPFAHDYVLLIAMPQGKPNKKTLRLADSWLDAHRQTLLATAPRKIKLHLPKWRLQRDTTLIPLLKADGVRTIFTAQADLSGIGPGLFVKEFKQNISLNIDEAGGEAAVATTAVIVNRSISIDPIPEIHIDRPFVYAVVHKNSGIDILKGYLHNPVAQSTDSPKKQRSKLERKN